MTRHPEQFGPFRVTHSIGQGGMGAVYAAVHEESQEAVAVKVLPESLAGNTAFRERFRNEIETLKKLSHPNIVQLHGFGEQDGLLFYVMELVEGRSLQELLEEGKRFTWEEVTQIGIQICRALKHAQDHGVIHRDLKPANLLMTAEQHVKLSDFGIAKLFGATQMTVDGGVIGTVHYMSPEQAAGQRVSARSDLYSLGAVLYTLLARRPPHVGKSAAAVLHSLQFDPPPDLRRFAPDIPNELEQIIMQLLEKDPKKRIATPLAVANRLQAMQHGLRDGILEPGLGDSFFGSPSADAATIDATPSQLGIAPADDPGATRTALPEDQVDDEYTIAPLDTGGATSTHYTKVDLKKEQERLLSAPDEGVPGWLISIMLLIGLAVIAGLVFFLMQPPDPDKLYRELADASQSVEQLEDHRDDIRLFLEQFPDHPQAAKVKAWQEEIDRQRMQRQFQRRVRRADDLEQLQPIERAYLDIVRLAPFDPEKALRRVEALITLYEPDVQRNEEIRKTVELAKVQQRKLAARVKRIRASEEASLRARMERIAEIEADNPEQARAMYESVVVLYGEYAWARPFVEKARRLARSR